MCLFRLFDTTKRIVDGVRVIARNGYGIVKVAHQPNPSGHGH
jgi:hypothetical protein